MIYRFNDFDLNASSRRLMRAGRPVAIQPKPFALLLYLIRHRERVVQREELLSELWRGVHIDDVAVRFTLHAVRRDVGDDGKRQAIIRTAQRAGFQFTAPVQEIASPVLGNAIRVVQPFVGPERFGAAFESLLESVGRGESRILLLSAAADTQRTCTLEQLASIVKALGFRVLHSSCVGPDGVLTHLHLASEGDLVGERESASASSRARAGAGSGARA